MKRCGRLSESLGKREDEIWRYRSQDGAPRLLQGRSSDESNAGGGVLHPHQPLPEADAGAECLPGLPPLSALAPRGKKQGVQ